MKIWLNRIKTFLNSTEEWHAFAEGVCDGFCPLGGKYKPSKELQKVIESEHHYYRPGFILGFIAFIWFAFAVYKAVA